jgi:hypothetical protein
LKADRPAFLMDFLHIFYNFDVTGGNLVSERVLEDNWNVAAGASASAFLIISCRNSTKASAGGMSDFPVVRALNIPD